MLLSWARNELVMATDLHPKMASRRNYDARLHLVTTLAPTLTPTQVNLCELWRTLSYHASKPVIGASPETEETKSAVDSLPAKPPETG
jgi:hypothetical protein